MTCSTTQTASAALNLLSLKDLKEGLAAIQQVCCVGTSCLGERMHPTTGP